MTSLEQVLPAINSGARDTGRKVTMFYVDDVEVAPGRLRDVDDSAVDRLAQSMSEVGLRTPISVRHYTERPNFLPAQASTGDAVVLWTGAHRLAAAKRLGWEQIECIVYFEGDEIDGQLWEIAENLHRAELTKAQRDDHIRRYAALLAERAKIQATQVARPEIGYKKPPSQTRGVASKIAAETGLSADTVRRALNPDRAEAEKARRLAKTEQQAGDDRQRQEAASQLSPEIQKHIAAADERRVVSVDADTHPDDIEELRNTILAQAEEIAGLQRNVAKFDDMVVEYERGGFENVIEGLHQRIELLSRQVERESKEKVANLRAAEYWKGKALAAGANDDVVIDMATGEMARG